MRDRVGPANSFGSDVKRPALTDTLAVSEDRLGDAIVLAEKIRAKLLGHPWGDEAATGKCVESGVRASAERIQEALGALNSTLNDIDDLI